MSKIPDFYNTVVCDSKFEPPFELLQFYEDMAKIMVSNPDDTFDPMHKHNVFMYMVTNHVPCYFEHPIHSLTDAKFDSLINTPIKILKL